MAQRRTFKSGKMALPNIVLFVVFFFGIAHCQVKIILYL